MNCKYHLYFFYFKNNYTISSIQNIVFDWETIYKETLTIGTNLYLVFYLLYTIDDDGNSLIKAFENYSLFNIYGSGFCINSMRSSDAYMRR